MGARLVKDINPEGSSSPNELVSINGLLFFSAEVSATAPTEGNSADDQEDSELEADTPNSLDEAEAETPNPSSDTQPSGGVGLISSDGSDDGTTILRLFDSVSNLVKAGNNLYFIAGINNQYQLWTSDGTIRGTKQVKDLYPNADPNFPQDLFEIDGVLFYSAIDGTGDDGKYPYVNGYEVWRREGKGVGSRFFRNLIPDRIITEITPEDEATGSQLILDGNGQPIELITTTTVNTVIGNDGFTTITTTIEEESYVNGKVQTTTNTIPQKVATDPRNITTTQVTEALAQSTTNPAVFLKTITTVTKTVDIQAGLTTETTSVQKDYEIDGAVSTQTTTSSTEVAFTPTDLNSNVVSTTSTFASEAILPAEVTTEPYENDSFPSDFVGINGNYFFIAQSSAFYSVETIASDILVGGRELWFSDGTEGGTRPITINQNAYSYYEPEDGDYTTSLVSQPEFGFKSAGSSSFPRELTASRNRLYFVANDGNTGFELWSITDQGTKPSLISDLNPGNTSSSPEELTVVGKNLYFSANQGSGRKLYYYNKSLNEPKLVKNSGDNPESLTAVGKELYYSAESELGRELWSAKKSKSMMVEDINPGSESSSPSDMTMVTRIIKDKSKKRKSKYLYFTADDGSHGTEIMSVNLKGKKNKVDLNSDIIDGPSSSFPRELTNHGQQLYFTAKDSSKGRELWSIGSAIKGPSGESGASSSNINIFENKTFVYQFRSDDEGNNETNWKINGGNDASFFQINSENGKLEFKSKQAYKNPEDYNGDNIYEVFVRSIDSDGGYKSDQLINVSISSTNTSDPKNDEILYYTSDCGPITANGPLYPCEQDNFDPITGSGSSNSIPTVTGSNLNSDGRQNYNQYNSFVDDYNSDGDCFAAQMAKRWASSQLTYENDPTLAQHFNQYFSPSCNLTELIV